METVADNGTEAAPPKKQTNPRFRLQFLAAFFLFFAGFALATLGAHFISAFIFPGDALFGPLSGPVSGLWLVFFAFIGTYGVVFAAIFGALFRLLSFYRLTESEFVRASLFGKQIRIPWADISNVERVRALRFFRIPVYRVLYESSDRPLYFVNWLSKRKVFDARIAEYTQDSHPFHVLLRKASRKQ